MYEGEGAGVCACKESGNEGCLLTKGLWNSEGLTCVGVRQAMEDRSSRSCLAGRQDFEIKAQVPCCYTV